MSFLSRLKGRLDSWENPVTGLGTWGRDKQSYSTFCPNNRLGYGMLSNLYNHDDLAKKCVKLRPQEMLRQGYEIQHEKAEEIKKAAKELQINQAFLWMMIWGRLYGGCVLILGIDDGQTFDKPLDETRIRSFSFLNVLDRRWLRVAQFYQNPLQPKFREPEIYEITNPMGGSLARIHESRIVRWDGERADLQTEWELNGWSFSVLQAPWDALRKFSTNYDSAGHLLQDASQGVYKMKGLIDAIASKEQDTINTRMKLLDMGKSVLRAILLDADGEDYTRTPTPFSGIPEMLDRQQQRLAAAFDMPVTLLMGRSPAGENATGDSDFRAWYDKIGTDQENDLKPRMERVYRLVCIANGFEEDSFSLTFKPLNVPSPKELSEIYWNTAQGDEKYVLNGVLPAHNVALSRFRPEGFSQLLDLHDAEGRVDAMKKTVWPTNIVPAGGATTLDQSAGAPGNPQQGDPVAGAGDSRPSAKNQPTIPTMSKPQ